MDEDLKLAEDWLQQMDSLFYETHINNTKERNLLRKFIDIYKDSKNKEKFYNQLEQSYFKQAKELTNLNNQVNIYQAEINKISDIKKELKEHINFENNLKKNNIEPDLFNQGRFYVANNINKILYEDDCYKEGEF